MYSTGVTHALPHLRPSLVPVWQAPLRGPGIHNKKYVTTII